VNLDFGLDPVFSWYVVLLCLSGVVMVALGAISKGERSVGSRALGVIAGLGFLGYGIYLGFIFDGGSYMMFFQAFILPAVLVVNFIRLVVAKPAQPQPYMGAPVPGVPAQGQTYPAQQPPYAGGQAPQYPGAPAQGQPYAGGPAPQYPGQPQAGPAQPYPTQPS
jgi:hypothetical protein